jgi:hypothetical protein
MKRILLIFIMILFITACGNSLYKDTEKLVLGNNFDEIENDIKVLFDHLSMFPTEEDENQVVTYLQVIYDNKDVFSPQELEDIKNIYHSRQYTYKLNTMGYDINKVNNLVDNLDK